MAATAHKPASKTVRTGPIEETWQHIMEQAIREEASDIHIEPGTAKLVIRFRRHGLLSSPTVLPKRVARPLAHHLKTRAQLDTDQTNTPQSGTFTETLTRRSYELSLATAPLEAGERLVVHLHDPIAAPPSLESLGLWGAGLRHVQQTLTQPHGLIITSGPNHSGVSITLASLAATVVHPAHKVVSVETEIAYRVPSIDYMSVQPNTGMTWQRVLSLQLKHEPDVVALGAMPNRATAELAISAAQHRQLILGGVPADDHVEALTKLARLSGNAAMLASCLRLSTNQRLAWHLCTNCRESYVPGADLQEALRRLLRLDRSPVAKQLHQLELQAISQGLAGASNEPSTSERGILQLWRAKAGGCKVCHGSGYTGAVALFSVLPIDDQLRSLVAQSSSLTTFREAVSKKRILSWQVDGIVKALRGLIAIESILNL